MGVEEGLREGNRLRRYAGDVGGEEVDSGFDGVSDSTVGSVVVGIAVSINYDTADNFDDSTVVGKDDEMADSTTDGDTDRTAKGSSVGIIGKVIKSVGIEGDKLHDG
eukprot:6404665-Ditylum_brightwellii.AAC.1